MVLPRRSELHEKFEEMLGSTNVYFQPPPTLVMSYPCIVYKVDQISTQFAGNQPYRLDQRYLVTYISRDPDSDIPMKLAALPQSLYNRGFAAGGLNHSVFILYF